MALYAVLNHLDGAHTIDTALANAGAVFEHGQVVDPSDIRDLLFVALDIEVDGVTRKVVTDAARRVREVGLRPIIYTGKWFWYPKAHLGDPMWGVDLGLPLWVSIYDGHVGLEFEGKHRFGRVDSGVRSAERW